MDYLQVPSFSNAVGPRDIRRTSAPEPPTSQRFGNTNLLKMTSYDDVVKVVDREFYKSSASTPSHGHIPMSSVIVQPMEAVQLGPAEQRLHCPHCRQLMLSVVEARSTYKTHLVALLMCALGGCCFAPLPYVMDTCKTLNHFCSQCGQHLGKYDM